MPELPEVETIVRELKKKISGKELRKIFVFDAKLKKFNPPLPFKITSVDRHGKYIVFHSTKGKILLHLRMSGRLEFSPDAVHEKTGKRERILFVFNSGVLRFMDHRRFGTAEWQNKNLPELGIDPLSAEFGSKAMLNILSAHSRGIKALLLDQKLISGLGNIYADESLWLAKIDPCRKSDSLSEAETARLASAIKAVLKKAIEKGGFTLRDYRKPSGKTGSYQKFRKVYGREGLPCPRCRGTIKRIKIGGRSSYFCPKCQK